MVRLFLTISFFVLTNSILCQQLDSLVSKKQFIEMISCKYSTNSKVILDGSPIETGMFVSDSRLKNVLLGYATEIHENLHIYNNYLSAIGRLNRRTYFLDSTNTISLSKYLLPSSKVIVDSVPDEVKKISTRYWIYIEDSMGVGNDAHLNGAYGLIEEFLAYQTSLQAGNDCYFYIKEQFGHIQASFLLSYLNSLSDYVLAYYEFRYFNSLYLKILKTRDFVMFNKLNNDSDFKRLIEGIDRRFISDIETFNQHKSNALNEFKDQISYIDGIYYYRQNGNLSVGFQFSEDKIELMRKINDFRAITD